MTALREVAAIFGVEFDGSKLARGQQLIDGAVGALKTLQVAMASNAIVNGIRDFANRFEEDAGRVQDVSEQLGVTTDALQSLQFAAGQSGVGAEQLNAALAKLQLNLGRTKAGPAAEALRTLGVSTQGANGSIRSATDVMDDVAIAMSRVDDPARRVALATQIFGTAGRRLIPILHEGEGGVAALRRQFDELGGGLSEESIRAADEYGDSMGRMKVAMDGLRSVVANTLLPVLTRLTEWFNDAIPLLIRITRGTHVFEVALAALAATALVMLGPVVAQFALLAAGIAAVVLIADDLITFFEGGDSVLGRFIDRMAGVGASRNLVRSLGEAWDGLKLVVNDAGSAISQFASSASSTLSGWATSVGTYFSDAWNGMKLAASNAWQAIDQATGGALTRMLAMVHTFIDPVIEMFNGLRNGITSSLAAIGIGGSEPNQPGGRDNTGMAGRAARVVASANPVSAASAVPDALMGVLRDWRDLVLNVPGLASAPAAAPARTQTVAAVARTQNVTSTRSTTVGSIQIHTQPGQNSREIAQQVRRVLAEEQASTNDAAHPLTHPEEG